MAFTGAVTLATASLRGPLRRRESHLWSRDETDFYIEPEWVSERLFDEVEFWGDIHDPACGTGRILDSAAVRGYDVLGSDLIVRRRGYYQADFLTSSVSVTNIVTNPPFSLAEQFVRHALSIAACKVAMLLPAIWLLGDKRSRWLETTPLARVLFITPRPSMPPGAAIMAGQKPGNGTADYAWLIWSRGYMGTIRRECLDHMIVFEEAHLRRKPWEVCRLLK